MNLLPVRHLPKAPRAAEPPAIKPEEPPPFRELVSAYEDRLLHAALQVLRCERAALQATESAFVRAYQRLGRPHSVLRPDMIWMYRLLIDACMDQIRAAERETQRPRDKALSSASVTPRETETETETEPGSAVVARMDRAISELAPRRRIVFVLAHFEGLSFHQIGDVLDITASCARVTYHAAMLELCSKLGQGVIAELQLTLQPQMEETDSI